MQLPNYGPALEHPVESEWAELREQQRKVLTIPDPGLIVTIDLGEWNDIHPLRKKDIGDRLALSAQKVAYKEDVVFSGPLYKGIEIIDSKYN